MLDIVGDLALTGRFLQAHMVAVRPSHSANCELARRIVEQMRRPETLIHAFGPPPPRSVAAKSSGGRGGGDQVQGQGGGVGG